MDYKYSGDFNKAPLGAFTEENKKKVWGENFSYDADKAGKYFEIVADDRFPGGRACRMKYGKDTYGMKDQFYQIRIPSPKTICNLEFLFMWENNFSFYNSEMNKDVGGGKVGPCINWGEVGGTEDKRGTRCMIWFNAQGSNHDHPVFSPSCQDQRTGNQLVQPVKYSKPFEMDKLYKFHIKMKGGKGGFAKYYITYPGETTKTLLAETGTKDMKAYDDDDVLYDFAFFHGGASNEYMADHDSYARHGGIKYWSGDGEYDSGNAEEGSGESGGTTPTPPSGVTSTSPFSIAIDEVKILRAHFYDSTVYPPKEIKAGADVKWKLEPNNVSWGSQEGEHWSGIQVKGKTVGGPCTLVATDPSTGKSTVPVMIDITASPQERKSFAGICVVEEMMFADAPGSQSMKKAEFKDKPPQ